MLQYSNSDLSKLIEKIHNESPYPNRHDLASSGWPEVANATIPWNVGEESFDELRRATSRLWGDLARNFLDSILIEEYNGIKHGLRVHPGEWYLNMAADEVPGVPAEPEKMQRIAHNKYGSSFFRSIKIKTHAWQFGRQSVGWDPESIAARLELIVFSMKNLLTYLRRQNGGRSENIRAFDVESVSEAFKEHLNPSNARFGMRTLIEPDEIPDKSPQDILYAYLNDRLPKSAI